MVLSLDNLANATVQKNYTIEQLVQTNNQLTAVNKKLMEHVSKLEEQNSTLLHMLARSMPAGHREGTTRQHPQTAAISGIHLGTAGPMVLGSERDTIAKPATLKEPVTKREQLIRTSWEVVRPTGNGHQKPDRSNQQAKK